MLERVFLRWTHPYSEIVTGMRMATRTAPASARKRCRFFPMGGRRHSPQRPHSRRRFAWAASWRCVCRLGVWLASHKAVRGLCASCVLCGGRGRDDLSRCGDDASSVQLPLTWRVLSLENKHQITRTLPRCCASPAAPWKRLMTAAPSAGVHGSRLPARARLECGTQALKT